MSFILDALKKSEAERQRQAGPALLEMRVVRPTRRLPVWVIVVGVLLVVNVGVLGWLAWRPASYSGPAPPQAVAPASQMPAGVAVQGVAPQGVAPQSAAAASVAPPAAAAPAGSVAPEPAPSRQPAADLDDNPADAEPAVAPAAARNADRANNLHNYAELSGQLPELRLDLHVYAANSAERYAFINMRKVREGDVTPEGVAVKEITREGVVLDFRGTEFLLGRQ
jgi:general secretion pathway protein B